MHAHRRLRSSLAITLALGGCAIGYHGRVDSAEQTPHGASAQLLYLGRVLAGFTVTSADLRDTVSSEGRSEARYGVPVGVRVLDTSPDDIEGRWELWPFAGAIIDGGAPGLDVGAHLRYQRLGYLALGLQRTFGDHGDTQGFVGFGVEVGRALCGCLAF